MTLNDIYVGFVNLDHRKDRLEHINKQLDRVGLSGNRTRGILPKEYKGHPDRVRRMMDRTPGAVGCHFSQVRVMEQAFEKEKHALVLEDDVIFCEDFQTRMQLILGFLSEREWDVFWLGGTFHVPAFWHTNGKSKMQPNCSANIGKDAEWLGGNFVRTYGAFSTYAYVVNRKSNERIRELLNDNLEGSIGIDWLFIKLQPQLKCFAFVPGCCKQMDNKSDIGNGDTIFSGFSKLNGTKENSAYWYQERMEDFNPYNFKWT